MMKRSWGAFLAIVLAFGCAGRSGAGSRTPLPDWAIHVKPKFVQPSADPAKVADELTVELGSSSLNDGHLAPEQIAAVAVHDLKAGRLRDAAVLLSAAGFRYAQQAAHVGETAFDDVPGNVNYSAYGELVAAERKTFAQLDFDDPLKTLTQFMRQPSLVEGMLAKSLGDEGDQTLEAREMRGIPKIDSGYPIQRRALADALYRRLTTDASDVLPGAALFYLAQVPEERFAIAALELTNQHTATGMCEPIARYLAEYEGVAELLKSRRPKTRSNVALVLGMNPLPEHATAVAEALAEERDAHARLALAYASVRHGEPAHQKRLLAALEGCSDDRCSEAAALLQWLGADETRSFPTGPFIAVLSNGDAPTTARRFSAAVLRDVGELRGLGAAEIEALVQASNDDEEKVAEIASASLARVKNLDRAAVLRWIEKHPKAKAALLGRFERVAKKDDFDFVNRELEDVRGNEDAAQVARALFEVAAKLSTKEADGVLLKWFQDESGHQLSIALALLSNGAGEKRLAPFMGDAKGAARALLMIAGDQAGADDAARAVLANGDINDRFVLARLLGLLGRASLESELWRLARYEDASYYPSDALLRQTAAEAVVRMALAQTVQREKRQLAQRFAAHVEAQKDEAPEAAEPASPPDNEASESVPE